ncbi:hypothetical protein T07_10835 [Trichinella nelsoni]|uniref:Uncharacterized protein n=1 Tax=Trichinella nelsoni TaxID=6336 RepID=A0A0V0S0P2_9BILA|nr:hypothetical protein T07_10835 [Trichinella nelsoni]
MVVRGGSYLLMSVDGEPKVTVHIIVSDCNSQFDGSLTLCKNNGNACWSKLHRTNSIRILEGNSGVFLPLGVLMNDHHVTWLYAEALSS